MQHISTALLSQLKVDYPAIEFVHGDDFKWSHTAAQLTVGDGPELYLLHEVAHAHLNHKDFFFDIELLKQEREAWDLVRSYLSPKYSIRLHDELIEDALDTYRDWMHSRSLCPSCGLTGLQTKTSTYVCINCRCSWRPNDARRRALRRYMLT